MRAGGSYGTWVDIQRREVLSNIAELLKVNVQVLQPLCHITVLQGTGDKDARDSDEVRWIEQAGICAVGVVKNWPRGSQEIGHGGVGAILNHGAVGVINDEVEIERRDHLELVVVDMSDCVRVGVVADIQ